MYIYIYTEREIHIHVCIRVQRLYRCLKTLRATKQRIGCHHEIERQTRMRIRIQIAFTQVIIKKITGTMLTLLAAKLQ